MLCQVAHKARDLAGGYLRSLRSMDLNSGAMTVRIGSGAEVASEYGPRKAAAILTADVVGCSRLVGADEERTIALLRALHSDLIDPTIAMHHGRVVKCIGTDSDQVPQRRRRYGAYQGSEPHRRAHRRFAGRATHCFSHRHSSRRRR
jgi:class 3 adenylate cyclase